MVLFTQEHCPHCPPELKETIKKLGGHVFDVVQHPDGTLYLKIEEGMFSELDMKFPGLPALIVNEKIYIGGEPIKEFLNKECAHV